MSEQMQDAQQSGQPDEGVLEQVDGLGEDAGVLDEDQQDHVAQNEAGVVQPEI